MSTASLKLNTRGEKQVLQKDLHQDCARVNTTEYFDLLWYDLMSNQLHKWYYVNGQLQLEQNSVLEAKSEHNPANLWTELLCPVA